MALTGPRRSSGRSMKRASASLVIPKKITYFGTTPSFSRQRRAPPRPRVNTATDARARRGQAPRAVSSPPPGRSQAQRTDLAAWPRRCQSTGQGSARAEAWSPCHALQRRDVPRAGHGRAGFLAGRGHLGRGLLEELGHHPRPAGLVAGAHAPAAVAVEVPGERGVLAPV